MNFSLVEWTFSVSQNDFLFFESGSSEDVTLQWATYRDASDQVSLSRIWGGIHPPIDDIRGRQLGFKIGNDAFDLAMGYFSSTLNNSKFVFDENISIFPNPFSAQLQITNLGNTPYTMSL